METTRDDDYGKFQSMLRILNVLTNVSVDDFNDRLRLQKIVYLAREIGFDCGFAFDWYVRGPYSPSLTRMLYSANELGTLRIDYVELSHHERSVAENLKRLLGDRKSVV